MTGIRTGDESGGDTTTVVTGATIIAGAYGTLTINPDGSFTYDVDSTNLAVIALPAGSTLTDTFTYKIADTAGLTDLAVLNVIVRGVNDPPVAIDVYPAAVEAGGVANGTPGIDPSGDAMANDFDPDGDPINVVGVRSGDDTGGATGLVAVAPGSNSTSNGTAIIGTYGTLTIGANGTYVYVVDNNKAAVQALRTGANTLSETFTYQIADNAAESDLGQIIVTIEGRNDNPVGVDDLATAVEAGGLNNAVAGTNPTGNVLTSDTDVHSVANGETKSVSAVRTGAEAATGTAGTIGVALAGSYGSLTLNADGSYQYVVNNANAAVQALRTSGNTLTELFTYTVSDTDGASDLAQLTITIQGANDTPLANPDVATAVEAGGLNNGTAGTNPGGNVLTNDSDVDAAVNGETRAVSAFANSASVAGTLGTALAGTYGSLTLNADGNYTYVVNNANATVQGLRTSSNTLTDTFTYTMRDAAGATSSTTLTITIRGANDNPLAVNDTGTALEAGGLNNGTPGSNAAGDVLFNDTDVDNVAYGETKTVLAIRTGTEAGSGTASSVGSALTGNYGALTLNANGSYTYVVDNANAAVQALRTTANTLSETFTYTMRDAAGATDVAQLTITIQGANDTPVAVDDSAFGWPEIFGSPGSGRNPTGNVLPNDSDVDAVANGETKAVSGIRTGAESPVDPLTPVAPGTSSGSGVRIDGTYGWLNIGADGSYLYEVRLCTNCEPFPRRCRPGFFHLRTQGYRWPDRPRATDRQHSRQEQSSDRHTQLPDRRRDRRRGQRDARHRSLRRRHHQRLRLRRRRALCRCHPHRPRIGQRHGRNYRQRTGRRLRLADAAGRRHLHLSRRQRQSAGGGLAHQRRYADGLLHLHRFGHLRRGRPGDHRRHHPRCQRHPGRAGRRRHGGRDGRHRQYHPGQQRHRQRADQRQRCRWRGLRRNEGRFRLRLQRRHDGHGRQRAGRRLWHADPERRRQLHLRRVQRQSGGGGPAHAGRNAERDLCLRHEGCGGRHVDRDLDHYHQGRQRQPGGGR